MKNVFFSALAALLFSASVQAQSTVDSIAAKYKLIPMPEALTIEKTFPVLGSYQLTTPMATTATTGSTTTTATDVTTSNSTTTSTDASMNSSSNIMVTLDSFNKGIVWVEGLPQGKFKAYLKQSPATYRVIAQKTESGAEIPEGTMYLDSTTKTLNIALGRAFDDADPMGVFALNTGAAVSTDAATATDATDAAAGTKVKVKTKTSSSKKKEKLTFYTASKVEPVAAPVSTQDSTQQQQATDSTQQKQQ